MCHENRLVSGWSLYLSDVLLGYYHIVVERLQVILDGDEFPTAVLLVWLLVRIGQAVSGPRHDLQRLSWGLALIAFVSFGIAASMMTPHPSSSELLWILFRAGLAAGLTHGLASILLLPMAAVWSSVLRPIVVGLPLFVSRRIARVIQHFCTEWRRRRRRWQEVVREAERRPQREVERQKLLKRQAVGKQEREQRMAIRYELELLYDRYRTELSARLPHERFQSYFDSYLDDGIPIPLCRARAEQLTEMIREQLNIKQTSVLPEFTEIAQVIEYFNAKKARLKTLNVDAGHTGST